MQWNMEQIALLERGERTTRFRIFEVCVKQMFHVGMGELDENFACRRQKLNIKVEVLKLLLIRNY